MIRSDYTPFNDEVIPSVFQPWEHWPYIQKKYSPSILQHSTPFSEEVEEALIISFEDWGTKAESEPFALSKKSPLPLSSGTKGEAVSYSQRSVSEEAEIANSERIRLLARRYVRGQLSSEEDARLEIVTERVRRLMPRVSAEDFERLETIISKINKISAADDRLRQELGL